MKIENGALLNYHLAQKSPILIIFIDKGSGNFTAVILCQFQVEV